MSKYSLIQLLLISLLLIGCAANKGPAPIRNLSTLPEDKQAIKQGYYQVKKGDTLYAIAFKLGVDFKRLASLNGIKAPYQIHPGQRLQLSSVAKQQTSQKPDSVAKVAKSSATVTAKAKSPAQSKPSEPVKPAQKPRPKPNLAQDSSSIYDSNRRVSEWQWPVKKLIKKNFSSKKDGLKGIALGGDVGQPIKSVAAGRVVYTGNGLVGYGNLIIIKHNEHLLSAYAHTASIKVKEQQLVKAGQVIATMGKNDIGQVQLHFEIRYQGRPVNPLKYLP